LLVRRVFSRQHDCDREVRCELQCEVFQRFAVWKTFLQCDCLQQADLYCRHSQGTPSPHRNFIRRPTMAGRESPLSHHESPLSHHCRPGESAESS
jgi:hypothetical protein